MDSCFKKKKEGIEVGGGGYKLERIKQSAKLFQLALHESEAEKSPLKKSYLKKVKEEFLGEEYLSNGSTATFV